MPPANRQPLSRSQLRRAHDLAKAGLSRRDSIALVSMWDAMPPQQRWALSTKEEQDQLRAANPEYAAMLDQAAERDGFLWR